MLLFSSLWANEEQILKRVQAHLLIHDTSSACKEASNALQQYPQSEKLWEAYIQALAKARNEKEMISAWNRYATIAKTPYENRKLLEEMSWGILNQGAHSSLPMIRIMALLGAFFAQDAKGVEILASHLKDSNAIVRGVAVELSAHMRDAKLCDTMLQLLRDERMWAVRLEVIKAVGAMKLHASKDDLTAIIANDRSTAEEKAAAIQSLVHLLDHLNREEVMKLARSDRAGLRMLACEVVGHFSLERDLDCMIALLQDHCSEVRVGALEAIGSLPTKSYEGKPISTFIEPCLKHPDDAVAITAARILTLHDHEKGQQSLQQWLQHDKREVRLMAAAALAACGKHSLPLAMNAFRESKDLFVRMNLALALIGQRIATEEACAALYQGLTKNQERWMWKEQGHFRILTPSDLKFADAADNHPEEVSQLVHLEILNIIAMMKFPKAQEAVTQFLQEKTWGVSAMAAALLLMEGDEASIEIVSKLLEHPSFKVRVQAALILSMWSRDEKPISVLQASYENADRDMKGKILEGIGRIGATTSIPFLVDKLGEHHHSLRIIAACVLLQCLYH